MDNNIFLIGFMGAGKTTVGRRLSWKLHIPVEDTDKTLELFEGMTISEIFQTKGEEAFRDLETEFLGVILKRPYPRIISAGGGMPVRVINRSLMREAGTVTYLRVRPETVWERLKDDDTRPLLQCEDPVGKIKELMDARKEAYESCADIILDVDELTPQECVDRLVKILEERK
ncbi:MAG: shikimate kinase [Lachnospiraceae bacterium]|nr:shikimate kinase [Lachnospiraceae bacterium]